eukprot:12936569-Alexandrium_andersonii.AAC.1
MSASLVGSEMCIRDRGRRGPPGARGRAAPRLVHRAAPGRPRVLGERVAGPGPAPRQRPGIRGP